MEGRRYPGADARIDHRDHFALTRQPRHFFTQGGQTQEARTGRYLIVKHWDRLQLYEADARGLPFQEVEDRRTRPGED